MAKTIVGLYDDRTTASRVLDDLQDAGFGNDHLQFTSNEKGSRYDYEVDASTAARPGYLSKYGVADNEAKFYAEGVRRGGSLVIARVHDDDVDRAVDIMARHNPVRYEDRHEDYDYDESAAAYTETEVAANREAYAGQAQQRFKEIQENLKIGKREVVRGGVRVNKYVDTDVQEETLRLREEHVNVDRTAVNRPATAADLDDAFEDKSIEMVERAEEAVVEKSAVVTGEVAVGKDVDVREETVGGEVRSTRVEVEQIAADTYVTEEPAFREHYESTYATTDRDFDAYKPAYQYGYAAGQTYKDRDYGAVEMDLRRDYSDRYHEGDESLWDETKDAVRHGYNRAKAAVT